MAKRQNFSAAFKAKVALEALRGDQTLAELAGRPLYKKSVPLKNVCTICGADCAYILERNQKIKPAKTTLIAHNIVHFPMIV